MKSGCWQLRDTARMTLVAVLGALLVHGLPLGAEEKKPSGSAPSAVLVETLLVKPAVAAREVTAVGTVRSNESVTLATEIAGRIDAVDFVEGGRVTKGTVLARLDQSVATAERDRVKAGLALSEANYQRAETLFREQAVSARERDEALAQFRLDEAQLRLSEAQLAKTVIRAPFAGRVGLRQVSVGGYVQPGTAIASLDDIDPVKVDFRVPENYAAAIRTGQKASVTVDALPERAFSGTVYAIDPQIDEKGRSLLLRARVANADGALRPGMFATVKLSLGEKANALFVPEEAIISQGGRQQVYKVVAGKVEAVAVKTGLRRKGEVEVVAGLKAGEAVITAGHLKVRPGATVSVAPATGR